MYLFDICIDICNVHSIPIRFLCFIYLICLDSNQSKTIERQFLIVRFEFLDFELFSIRIPGSIERIKSMGKGGVWHIVY